MGMAENQGICSKASWVAPTGGWGHPCLDVPFHFGLVVRLLIPTVGWSHSGLSSKWLSRSCVAGERCTPRYGDLGPVLWQVVPQCLVISWKSILPTSLVRVLFVLPTFVASSWNLIMYQFRLFYKYLYIDPIIISEDFYKNCFSYRKVKTRHVYLWRGLTRCFCFQRIFETLKINWVWFSHAGIPDWLGCYLTVMLGSDRVL